MTDIERLERKLDLIIDALGLSENHRLAPAEVKTISQNILLKFNKKRGNVPKHERKKGS